MTTPRLSVPTSDTAPEGPDLFDLMESVRAAEAREREARILAEHDASELRVVVEISSMDIIRRRLASLAECV